ncbi:MAG: PLDc N-terminal domain-containing protein, partial [Lachnospiraceae bacterium]|nr:PLDc N-terminal domain-containing protein [Lachnospiraceae bacterium]
MPEKNMTDLKDIKPMRLLKKGKKGLFRVLFSRTGIILLFFLLGLVLIMLPVRWLAEWIPQYVGLAVFIQALMVLFLINSEMDATSKVTWLLVMMVFPLVGGFFYLYTRRDLGSRAVRAALKDKSEKIREALPEESEGYRALKLESPSTAALAKYIAGTGNYPVFRNTAVSYYPLGEYAFAAMLEDLKKAEHFIFLEFFIVDEGQMWGDILAVLAQKVAEGLDIRVMYDGTCEFSTLPHDYPDRLRALGIQCKVFSPMTPFVSTYYNYRDHRKI